MAHPLRSSIQSGEGSAAWQPDVSAEPCRRQSADVIPPESERRAGDDRRAERQRGRIERAALVFRGRTSLVPVANSSQGGLTIETNLIPEIGETVRIAMSGQPPLKGVVRWVVGGRVGLDIGSVNS
jgi:hypothetical protein